jgi:hypothetical protein
MTRRRPTAAVLPDPGDRPVGSWVLVGEEWFRNASLGRGWVPCRTPSIYCDTCGGTRERPTADLQGTEPCPTCTAHTTKTED